MRHAVRAHERRHGVREELRPATRTRRRSSTAHARAAARAARSTRSTSRIARPRRARVRRLAPDVAVGRRARRQRARRRDRQREDLDRRRPARAARRRCSGWISCGSGSNAARTADEALDVITDAARASTARADRRTRTATSRTSRRSSSPTRAAAGSSRRAAAPGPRARSATAPRSRIASSSTTDWTRRVGRRRARHRLRHAAAGPRMPTAIADHRLAATTRVRRASRGRRQRRRRSSRRCAITATARGARRAPAPSASSRSRRPAPTAAGVTVCMHRARATHATTASMIVELRTDAPPRAWACLGNPCAGVYVPVLPARGPAGARRPRAVAAVRPAARPGRGRARRARRGPRRARAGRARAVGRGRRARSPPATRAPLDAFAATASRRSTPRCIDSASSDPLPSTVGAAQPSGRRSAWSSTSPTLERVADTVPDHEALVCGDRRLTFAELDARANRLAHVLAARGVGAGDHVALLPLQLAPSTSKACSPRSSSARCRST